MSIRPCQGANAPDTAASDYEYFVPSTTSAGCLLGRVVKFIRRKDTVACVDFLTYEETIKTTSCACERGDYECDFGYSLNPSTMTCDLGGFKPLTPSEQCSEPDSVGGYAKTYYITRGYRKIADDECVGGLDLDRKPMSCVGIPIMTRVVGIDTTGATGTTGLTESTMSTLTTVASSPTYTLTTITPVTDGTTSTSTTTSPYYCTGSCQSCPEGQVAIGAKFDNAGCPIACGTCAAKTDGTRDIPTSIETSSGVNQTPDGSPKGLSVGIIVLIVLLVIAVILALIFGAFKLGQKRGYEKHGVEEGHPETEM